MPDGNASLNFCRQGEENAEKIFTEILSGDIFYSAPFDGHTIQTIRTLFSQSFHVNK
jgi:hypothetical protein